jgi:transcriptional regulator with XRE-family HTH domain
MIIKTQGGAMVIKSQEKFISWLDQELSSRNWSDYQLAKKAGISHSVISKARSSSPPKWDACLAISKALNVSPITVFRKAGLLPASKDDTSANKATFEDWIYLLQDLPEREQNIVRNLVIDLKETSKKNNHLQTHLKKAPKNL